MDPLVGLAQKSGDLVKRSFSQVPYGKRVTLIPFCPQGNRVLFRPWIATIGKVGGLLPCFVQFISGNRLWLIVSWFIANWNFPCDLLAGSSKVLDGYRRIISLRSRRAGGIHCHPPAPPGYRLRHQCHLNSVEWPKPWLELPYRKCLRLNRPNSRKFGVYTPGPGRPKWLDESSYPSSSRPPSLRGLY